MFDILSPSPRSRGGYVEIIKSIRGHVSEMNAELGGFYDDVKRSKFRVCVGVVRNMCVYFCRWKLFCKNIKGVRVEV